MDRRRLIGAMGVGLVAGPGLAMAQPAADLKTDARTAWLYVLPLIEMASARIRMLDRSRPGQHAGLNAFSHTGNLVGPIDHGITTPNNDTLYSNAFADLTQGPLTLTVPEAGSRYLSVAVMDMYTNNNAIVGARTAGGAAGGYRLFGPGHRPERKTDIQVATPHAWVLGRVLVSSQADLPAARRVQDRLMLSGPKVAAPSVYAERSDPWSAFFKSADALLKTDPPGSLAGRAAFERVRAAGKSGDFDATGYSAADAAAIAAGTAEARNIVEKASAGLKFTQGWSYPASDIGDFGDDIAFRAVVAVAGLGALTPPEAMYMRGQGEDGTWAFRGDGLYRLSLPRPIPVRGFWSLTMYEATADGQFYLTENPIKRYAIGDRTPGLRRGADGSIDIWIGRSDPGGARTANWLPAPKQGVFAITMRAYLPGPELLSGAYRLPPVTRV